MLQKILCRVNKPMSIFMGLFWANERGANHLWGIHPMLWGILWQVITHRRTNIQVLQLEMHGESSRRSKEWLNNLILIEDHSQSHVQESSRYFSTSSLIFLSFIFALISLSLFLKPFGYSSFLLYCFPIIFFCINKVASWLILEQFIILKKKMFRLLAILLLLFNLYSFWML